MSQSKQNPVNSKQAKEQSRRVAKTMDPIHLQKFINWTISTKHVANEEEFHALIGPLMKFIEVHSSKQKNGFTVLNFTVIKTGGPDDSTFLKYPLLQKILPRNLSVITTPWGTDIINGGMRKFFDIATTIKERKSKAINGWASIKENGKFTSSMFIRGPDGTIYIIFGSKNRLVVVDYSIVPDYKDYDAFLTFCKSMEFNEILVSMLEGLMKTITLPGFNFEDVIRLGEEGYTIVGENLDGKHITFEKEKTTRVFALCKNGIPINTNDARKILGDIGFNLVECVSLPKSLDIQNLTIRDLVEAGIQFKNNCEGCVVYIECEDGSVEVMKFKFPIYKLLRGLRRLIIMFGWTHITLVMLHDAILSKAQYHDISAEASARFYKWSISFVTCCKNAGISNRRVGHMLDTWGEDILPVDLYGMGAIINHFDYESLCVFPEELGLKDLDQFKKDFETFTTGMIPTVSSQDINKIVACTVKAQGSGKTTFCKKAVELLNEKYKNDIGGDAVYIDQDMFDGNSLATQNEMIRLVKDPSVTVIILGRTNHDVQSFKAYLDLLREFPNVAVIFCGEEPNDASELISASGLISRTDVETLKNGYVALGSGMPYTEAIEIVKRVLISIFGTFFGESPKYPIHILNTLTESPFREQLVHEWSLLPTLEDQKDFIMLNMDKIATLRLSPSEIGEALSQVFILALSPSNPECSRFLRTYNVNSMPIELDLDYVSGKVSQEQGRPLITFAMEQLSKFGFHATTKVEGKGKPKPNGKVNSSLHLTVFHPKGEGLNPRLPDGYVLSFKPIALVIHKESGHVAIRGNPSIKIQNKNPHLTVYVPNGRTPNQSEFVGLNDDTVIIIPIDEFNKLELVIENIAKK